MGAARQLIQFEKAWTRPVKDQSEAATDFFLTLERSRVHGRTPYTQFPDRARLALTEFGIVYVARN